MTKGYIKQFKSTPAPLTRGCGLMPGGYLDPGQGAEGGERLATEAERLDTGQVGEVTL